MIESIASRICAKVIFIAYCVMSQEFHPPMYLQTLKTAELLTETITLSQVIVDEIFVLQGISSKPTSSCANNLEQFANYKVFIHQMSFALANK